MVSGISLKWVEEDGNSRLTSSAVAGVKPRRAHTKSRQGCVACKRRRKKCDETFPSCSLCKHMKIRCEYPQRRPEMGSAKSLTQGQRQFSMSRDLTRNNLLKAMDMANEQICMASFPEFAHLDALQLLDHFLNESSSWIGSPSNQRILQKHGVRLGLEAPHFMHAILAFSASHIDYLQPDPRVRCAAVQHCDRLLASYKASVARLDTENVTYLFGTCTLLSMLTYMGVAYDNSDSNLDPEYHECDFDSFRTLQGSQILQGLPALREQLRQSVWSPALLEAEQSENDVYCDDIVSLNTWSSRVMSELCALCDVSTDLAYGDMLYLDALRGLNKLIHFKMDHSRIGQLMKFVATLTPDFIDQLGLFEPKTMTILAYFHALLLQSGQWWSVRTSWGACGRTCVYLWRLGNPDIRRLLQFPAAQCGLTLPL